MFLVFLSPFIYLKVSYEKRKKIYGANFHGKRSLTENLTETLVRKYQIGAFIL